MQTATARRERLDDDSAPGPVSRISEPETSGETVTVACKLPQGLQLRVFEWEDYDEPTPSGAMRKSKRAVEVGERFTLAGTSSSASGNLSPQLRNQVLPGGYALTHGVPKDLWEMWLEQNKRSALVTKEIVFARPSLQDAQKAARHPDHAAVRTGLEPVDPRNPGAKMPGERFKVQTFEKE